MIGTVESISYDGNRVLGVVLRFASRGSPLGMCIKEIKTSELIGQGSFGTVYRAACEDYPYLALKISTGKSTRIRLELDVLSRTCTKGKLHLPRFEFGALNQAEDLLVIGMELCVPRTLHELILHKPLVHESDMLFLAYQVALSVSFLHEEGCIHRDVKLQNFVFDLDGNVKLIDFGLSSNQMDPPPGDVVAGTVAFMAPEMAHNALYKDRRVSVGAAADIWSIGIVWFSIFTQYNPYHSVVTQQQVSCESSSIHNALSVEERETISNSAKIPVRDPQWQKNRQLLECVAAANWRWPEDCKISEDLKELVESVLLKNPADRPSLNSILRKPIWNRRRRSPPEELMAFLGVQDDLLLSHDEGQLMRAVEQRSAGVSASLLANRGQSAGTDKSREASFCPNEKASDPVTFTPPHVRVGSLKVVSHEECDLGGVPSVQVYDVRPSTHKKSKPIRDISVVIASEIAKKTRSRSRKALKIPIENIATRRSMATASIPQLDPEVNSISTTRCVQSSTEPPQDGNGHPRAGLTSPTVTTNELFSQEANSSNSKTKTHLLTSSIPVYSKKQCVVSNGQSYKGKNGSSSEHRKQEDAFFCRHQTMSLLSRSQASESSDDVVVENGAESSNSYAVNKIELYGNEMYRREGNDVYAHEAGGKQLSKIHVTEPFKVECGQPARKRSKQDAPEPQPQSVSNAEHSKHTPSSSMSSSESLIPQKEQPVWSVHTRSGSSSLSGLSLSSQKACLASHEEGAKLVLSTPQDPFVSLGADSVRRGGLNRKVPDTYLTLTTDPFTRTDMRDQLQKHRHFASIVMVEHEWLLASFRMIIEEDQERYSITWLAEHQVQNASHAHHFKRLTQIPSKKYDSGFVCDMCAYDFFPQGRSKKKLHFFHCTCGRDLCSECYIEYENKCTCDCCGIKHPNSQALRVHLVEQDTVKAKTVAVGVKKMHRPSAQNSAKRNSMVKSNLPPSYDRKKGQVDDNSSMRMSVVALSQEVVSQGPLEGKRDVVEPIKRRIEAIAKDPWEPLVKLRRDRQTNMLPITPEEREVILQGDWIRYFHLYPADQELSPFAFVYHIQPGRTGALFLINDFPIHSAIVSTLERQFFVVKQVDMNGGEDETRVTTLMKAKADPSLSLSFRALQGIEAYDTNSMKQKRIPGTVSVYQAPRSAYSTNKDPFAYLRWFRFSEDHKLSAFLLSSGGIQVFVNNEFELRWFDESRKFLVRHNGVCEVVTNRTFALAPAINHLLYDSF